MCIRCKNCNSEQFLQVPAGYGYAAIPRNCTGRQANAMENGGVPPAGDQGCPTDPFVIIPDKCVYMNQQTLKIQEAPEEVPTGELPRSIMATVDRQLADSIPPGSRVTLLAISSIRDLSAASSSGRSKGPRSASQSYLRVVGVEYQLAGTGRAQTTFTAEEDALFRRMASETDFFFKLAENVAPAISGDYTDDIKKAILCLLLGGSRKLLPDGTRLRGDINVLMLGDPSTAKSQFLKFVEKVAPVGVYTSGKGSSAAGLTASVLKSPSGEFFLEGGAMVMADGGVYTQLRLCPLSFPRLITAFAHLHPFPSLPSPVCVPCRRGVHR